MSPEDFQRAYHDAVYRGTKAILAPVVAALTEVITESVSTGVREGIKNAIRPDQDFWSLLTGKPKQRNRYG